MSASPLLRYIFFRVFRVGRQYFLESTNPKMIFAIDCATDSGAEILFAVKSSEILNQEARHFAWGQWTSGSS